MLILWHTLLLLQNVHVQAKAVGSDFLWRRLQELQPDLHVFGHSHFAWDAELQGEGRLCVCVLPQLSGCKRQYFCVRSAQACMCTGLHVFWHSHFAWDAELEGEERSCSTVSTAAFVHCTLLHSVNRHDHLQCETC
jgi:hypothetical protein